MGRGAGREAVGSGAAQAGMHAHGAGPTQGLGVRARAERTLNMWYMSVTWDVSKLSGWLKANTLPCQVEGRACDAG